MSMRKAATLRLAGARDIASVTDWAMHAGQVADARPLSGEQLRADLFEPDTNVLLVIDPDGIAALGVMHYGIDEATLTRLDVDRRLPALEREVGACLSMLRWFETSALAAGICVISIVVAADNPAAHGLLLAHGYRDFIEIGSDGEPRSREVRFSRDLSST